MKKAESNLFSNMPYTKAQLTAPILVLLLLFTCFIFYGALYPFHDWRIPVRPTLTILFCDWLDHIFLFDIVQNLILFFPFGLFLSSYLLLQKVPTKTSLWIPTLASLSISLTVELLQTFNPARIPSLLDITLNVISGLLGASMASLFMRHYPWMLRQVSNSIDVGNKQNLWPFIGMITWAGFACYQIYPFIPTLHPQQLLEGILPIFQCLKGDVPFYVDRLFLYTLQGTMVYFSGKLFLKSTHNFTVTTGFMAFMLLAKITILDRYLTIEMLTGCFGSICLLWLAEKAMDFGIIENKKELEVEVPQQ